MRSAWKRVTGLPESVSESQSIRPFNAQSFPPRDEPEASIVPRSSVCGRPTSTEPSLVLNFTT